MKCLFFVALVLSGCASASVQKLKEDEYVFKYPATGAIPDSKTAIEVGEAILSRFYGRDTIESERPFVAKLVAGIWEIEGTLHGMPGKPDEVIAGGVAIIKIRKSDGCVMYFVHEK